ncbi:MAG: hypothetical protein IAG13_18495 [Deltaproteobacteria bacterium]|nr:hypothetical protein [Nannocystaceae bacterium]
MEALIRLLELVARELGADDVRIELGLRAPREHDVWCELAGGFRLIATFDAVPAELDDKRERLLTLAETFATTIDAALVHAPQVGGGIELAAHALDETLAVLARSASAIAAVVVDDRSPVIWGSSLAPRGPEDADVAAWISAAAQSAARGGLDLGELLAGPQHQLEDRLARAELTAEDRTRVARAIGRIHGQGLHRTAEQWRALVATMRAIAIARRAPADDKLVPTGGDDLGLLARGFAGIYRVVLVFLGAYSELHAEAAAIRALPTIERLVTNLPPFDPAPRGGGDVVRLFPPRS